MMIDAEEGEEKVKEMALSNETVKKYLKEGRAKKIIYVKNRLVNIVI